MGRINDASRDFTDNQKLKWGISDEVRQEILQRQINILNDPASTPRQVGIASKLLAQLHRQDIEIAKIEGPQGPQQEITVRIIEEPPASPARPPAAPTAAPAGETDEMGLEGLIKELGAL